MRASPRGARTSPQADRPTVAPVETTWCSPPPPPRRTQMTLGSRSTSEGGLPAPRRSRRLPALARSAEADRGSSCNRQPTDSGPGPPAWAATPGRIPTTRPTASARDNGSYVDRFVAACPSDIKTLRRNKGELGMKNSPVSGPARPGRHAVSCRMQLHASPSTSTVV